MGANKLALRDIDLALSYGYPEDKAFKLSERKGECESARGEKSKALDSFQMAIKMIKKNAGLKKNQTTQKQQQKFIAAIEKKIEKVKEEMEQGCNNTTNDNINSEANVVEMPTPSNYLNGIDLNPDSPEDLVVQERSEYYESAHAAVEIKYEEGRGRYAVAGQDIELGTVLFREKPLTQTLNPEKFGTHCQHCFKPIRGIIPCEKCTWVCYCSTECRQIANETYHQYECGIINIILQSGFNVYAYMALRLVTKEGLENLLKLKNDLENNRSEKVGSEQNFYSSRDFRNAYNLMAHEDSISDDLWLLKGIVSVFLLKCLQQTDYFRSIQKSSENPELLHENELFVGKVLFRLLNVMPTNVHDISDFETPVLDTFVPRCNKVSLGAGLYPCLALVNHSCDPSFMRCNKGNEVICVASRKIHKGEEISENYGLMFTIKNFKERQEILNDHYKFECICKACLENWPLLDSMKSDKINDPTDSTMDRFLGIKCVHCGEIVHRKSNYEPFTPIKTCVICGGTTDLLKDIPIEKIKTISSKAVQSFVKGRWKEGLDLTRDLDQLVNKHFSHPVLEMVEAQVGIWKCMWLKYGNMRLVKTM